MTEESDFSSRPEFRIHPIHHDNPRFIAEGAVTIVSASADREILKQYDHTHKLPENIQRALAMITPFIAERFHIPLDEVQAPVILFKDDQDQFTAAMRHPFKKVEKGYAGYIHGAGVVADPYQDTVLELVSRGFHESLHLTGESHFANVYSIRENKVTNIYSRQGFEILNPNSPLSPWVLEEGFVAYMQTEFREVVGTAFLADKLAERNLLIYKQLDKRPNPHGFLSFSAPNNLFGESILIEPKYAQVVYEDPVHKNLRLTLISRTALAGSLFESVLRFYSDKEREEFVQNVQAARRDTSLVPQLARSIDNHVGKGTYVKLLRIPDNKDQDHPEVWNMIKELRTT